MKGRRVRGGERAAPRMHARLRERDRMSGAGGERDAVRERRGSWGRAAGGRRRLPRTWPSNRPVPPAWEPDRRGTRRHAWSWVGRTLTRASRAASDTTERVPLALLPPSASRVSSDTERRCPTSSRSRAPAKLCGGVRVTVPEPSRRDGKWKRGSGAYGKGGRDEAIANLGDDGGTENVYRGPG